MLTGLVRRVNVAASPGAPGVPSAVCRTPWRGPPSASSSRSLPIGSSSALGRRQEQVLVTVFSGWDRNALTLAIRMHK